MVEKEKQVVQKKDKMMVTMTPLLSWRSILALGTGLVVGLGFGVGFWAASPSLNSSLDEMAGVVRAIGTSPAYTASGQPVSGPFESIVQIHVVNPGSSYTTLKALQQRGEYYAAKANTFPFFKFLSEELAKEAPQYSYPPDQLNQMTRIRYDYKAEPLPAMEMKVLGNSDQEASFLAGFIPQVFQKYLVAEETEMRLKEQENALKEMGDVKAALFAAEQELAVLKVKAASDNVTSNPAYLALKAKVSALESQLNAKAIELAVLVAMGSAGQDYQNAVAAVDRTSVALGTAKRELATMEAQVGSDHLSQDVEYQSAETKVKNLEKKLSDLTQTLTASLSPDDDDPSSYLSVGTPSIPMPVPPDRMRARNAVMMGALLGIAVAWALLNFRWILKVMSSMSSPQTPVRKEDEDSEA